MSAERKKAYLAQLETEPSLPLAMRALDPPVTYRELARWRVDRVFRRDETALVGAQPVVPEMDRTTQQIIYLDALAEYEGNSYAARQLAGMKRADLDAFRRDDAFKEREDEVFEKIGDEIQATALRGAKDGKDLGHTMKVLGKMRKQWADEPKKIDHRHHGTVAIKPLAEQVAELEAEDGLDLLQPPD